MKIVSNLLFTRDWWIALQNLLYWSWIIWTRWYSHILSQKSFREFNRNEFWRMLHDISIRNIVYFYAMYRIEYTEIKSEMFFILQCQMIITYDKYTYSHWNLMPIRFIRFIHLTEFSFPGNNLSECNICKIVVVLANVLFLWSFIPFDGFQCQQYIILRTVI